MHYKKKINPGLSGECPETRVAKCPEHYRAGTEDFSCSIRQVIFTVTDIPGYLKRLRGLSVHYRSHIICFDEELMAGKSHVEAAVSHAFHAIKNGTCIASSVEIEALLYAAGSRQVIDGVKFGIHGGANQAYLCLCPENEDLWNTLSKEMKISEEDWESIDTTRKYRLISVFGITREELLVTGEDRLKDLVLERVALLDAYK